MTEKSLAIRDQKALSVRNHLFSDQCKDKLEMAIPRWLSVDRLLRVAYTAILKNPQLLDCTTESLMSAIMQCAQLGLEPVLNRAHLVPYRNPKKNNVLECQFQAGYVGLVDLARRSGEIKKVAAHVVYEKDKFEVEYGHDEHITHVPWLEGDRGKAIGVHAVWTYKDGTKDGHFYPVEDIFKRHRARSQAYKYAIKNDSKNTPWIADESAMLKKSAIKESSKLQPTSIEFMQAVELDSDLDTGRQTSGLLLDATTDMPLPAPDAGGPDDEEAIALQFDSSIPEGTDMALLNAYMTELCNMNKLTINEIKREAVPELERFWTMFRGYQEKQGRRAWKVDDIHNLKKTGFSGFLLEHWEEIPGMSQSLHVEVVNKCKNLWGVEYEIGTKPVFLLDKPAETTTTTTTEEPEDLTQDPAWKVKFNCPPVGAHAGTSVTLKYCQSGMCPKMDDCDEWQKHTLPDDGGPF